MKIRKKTRNRLAQHPHTTSLADLSVSFQWHLRDPGIWYGINGPVRRALWGAEWHGRHLAIWQFWHTHLFTSVCWLNCVPLLGTNIYVQIIYARYIIWCLYIHIYLCEREREGYMWIWCVPVCWFQFLGVFLHFCWFACLLAYWFRLLILGLKGPKVEGIACDFIFGRCWQPPLRMPGGWSLKELNDAIQLERPRVFPNAPLRALISDERKVSPMMVQSTLTRLLPLQLWGLPHLDHLNSLVQGMLAPNARVLIKSYFMPLVE